MKWGFDLTILFHFIYGTLLVLPFFSILVKKEPNTRPQFNFIIPICLQPFLSMNSVELSELKTSKIYQIAKLQVLENSNLWQDFNSFKIPHLNEVCCVSS